MISDSQDTCECDGVALVHGLSWGDDLIKGPLSGIDNQVSLSKKSGWLLCELPLRTLSHGLVSEDEDGDLELPRKRPRRLNAASRARGVSSKIQLSCLTSSDLCHAGSQLWGSALVLAEMLLENPDAVYGQRICELGAGVGLCSIIAWQLGAEAVMCSDGCEEVARNAHSNLRRNACEGSTAYAAIVRWEDPPNAPPVSGSSSIKLQLDDSRESLRNNGGRIWDAEVLLAADVLYDAQDAIHFASIVDALFRNGSARVLYLACEYRVYFSMGTLREEIEIYPQFWEACAERDLVLESIDMSSIPKRFDYDRSAFYALVAVRPNT